MERLIWTLSGEHALLPLWAERFSWKEAYSSTEAPLEEPTTPAQVVTLAWAVIAHTSVFLGSCMSGISTRLGLQPLPPLSIAWLPASWPWWPSPGLLLIHRCRCSSRRFSCLAPLATFRRQTLLFGDPQNGSTCIISLAYLAMPAESQPNAFENIAVSQYRTGRRERTRAA